MFGVSLGIIDSGGAGGGGGSYESIATVTVGSGGASTISFSSIPSTFKHLQIRYLSAQTNASVASAYSQLNFNSDTGGNYTDHQLYGDGSDAVAVNSGTSLTTIYVQRDSARTGAGANIFGATVMDILDYANTSKYKTVRYLAGVDANTASTQFRITLGSGLWMSTSAISSIVFTGAYSYAEKTTFALYGIKG
jgi:hypothetical protein